MEAASGRAPLPPADAGRLAPVKKEQHLAEWESIWSKVELLMTTRRVSWDRFARESFELVRVALIYQRNALEMYAEAELHQPLRCRNRRL